MHALADKLDVSLDGFIGGGIELGVIFIVRAGPRGIVASFYGPQPR